MAIDLPDRIPSRATESPIEQQRDQRTTAAETGTSVLNTLPERIPSRSSGKEFKLPDRIPSALPSDDIGRQIEMGLRESVVPFGISKQEFESTRPQTISGVVARAGSNILMDIATSTAAGALVGTAVTPVVGTTAGGVIGFATGLGLAIYRALGMENIMSKAEGGEMDPGRMLLNVGVEVNPLLKYSGKTAKFVTQAALQAAQSKSYGASNTMAVGTGLVGGGMSALANKHGLDINDIRSRGAAAYFADKGLSPRNMGEIADALSKEEGLELTRKAMTSMRQASEHEAVLIKYAQLEGGDSPQAFKRFYDRDPAPFDALIDSSDVRLQEAMLRNEAMELHGMRWNKRWNSRRAKTHRRETAKWLAAFRAWKQEVDDFAEFVKPGTKLTGEDKILAAQKALNSTGLETEQAWSMFRFQKHLMVALEETVDTEAKRLGLKDPLSSKLWRNFGDLRYVYNSIEDITGLPITGTYQQMMKVKDQHNAYMYAVTRRLKKALRKAKSGGVARTQILDIIEAGDVHKYEGKAREGLQDVRDILSEIRAQMQSKGMDIGYIENYVPRVTMSVDELIPTVEKAYAEFTPEAILRAYNANQGQIIRGEVNTTARDLARIFHAANGKLKTEQDVIDGMAAISNQKFSKTKTGYDAMAAFKRKNMPKLIREKDIIRSVLTYANNSYKSMAIDPVLRQFRMYGPILDELGWSNSSEYLQRYIKDMSGHPSDFAASMNQKILDWKLSLNKAIENPALPLPIRLNARVAKMIPDIGSFMMAQVYPNLLGWRLRPFIRNLSQPWVLSAPEIKNGMGHRMAARATVRAFRDLVSGKNLAKELEIKGLFPGKYMGEGYAMFERSLKNQLPFMGIEVVEAFGRAGMWLYGASDVWNRYVTRYMGIELAEMIMDGRKASQHFIRRLPAGARAELQELIRQGKSEQVKDFVVRYMISKTQFNYGRHAMNQLGREYGKFASMFTKWPAAIGSELIEMHRKGQYSPMVQKFMMPLAALSVMGNTFLDTEGSPRMKALLGRSVISWAPVLSPAAATRPPVWAEAAGQVFRSAQTAIEMDLDNGAAEYALKVMKPLKKANEPLSPLWYGVKEGWGRGYEIITDRKFDTGD